VSRMWSTARACCIEGVSGARVVGVAGEVWIKDVIGIVRQSAKAQRRPALVTLGGVVKHHVENDLDIRPRQRFHHITELARRFFLLDRQLSSTGAQVTLSGLVRALASPSLDSETSPPVTHAIPPIKDGLVLLGSPIGSTDVVTVTGTAIQADTCCGKEGDSGTPIPSQLMRGSLSFEGPAGEFISDGRRVSL
jgi:hypothetical protein